MEQLLDSGIPLEEEVVSELRASCQGLALYQAGTPVENDCLISSSADSD
jgi:hypothetical protein